LIFAIFLSHKFHFAFTNHKGWTKPTKIQTEALPIALKGNDIIALAQTGSG